ncbi:MAG: NUDIX domain-containing protein [Patescibacteria group bacterium]
MTDLVTGTSPEAIRKAGWSISIDGQLLENVGHVVIENPRFGRFSFGLRPEGTYGWGWKEVGGVGIVPWSIFKGKLLIGLVAQIRPFVRVSEYVMNIPRGFAKQAATFRESAAAEFREEVGLGGVEWPKRLEPLGDVATNANSTFFDTTDGRGFQFFAFETKEEELETRDGAICFRRELVQREVDPAEWIQGCVFLPWESAALVIDNFTSSGVARLLATKPELKSFL